MAGSYYGRSRTFFVALVVAAVGFIAAIPMAAIAFVRDVFVGLTDARPFRDLFETPALALAGHDPGGSIAPALAQHQRHEAGLARLGAVRHR